MISLVKSTYQPKLALVRVKGMGLLQLPCRARSGIESGEGEFRNEWNK